VRQQLLVGSTLRLYGVPLPIGSADVWVGAALLASTGAGLCALVWGALAPQLREGGARG
jgi:hypothetical protein